MKRLRVSVAMATCEGERFVAEQLESIVAQQRPPDEIVIFDDASGDETFERVNDFAGRSSVRCRVSRNETRLGIAPNFQQAIEHCNGELIFLADQDDVWLPDKIEKLAGRLEAEPEIGAVFSDGMLVDEVLASRGATLWQALGFDRTEQRDVRQGHALRVFLRHVVAAGTTMAFRADYRRYALPFPDLHSCHDAFLAFVIAALGRVAIVEEPLIQYRLHGANQIGIQKLGLRAQIAAARKQLETGAFDYAVEFFSAARERLADAPEVAPDTRTRIEAKIDHSRRRAEMSGALAARLPDIGRETLSGRYWRYSYGIKSVAQDLWLR